mmetsp:Transcript_130112/g.362512  ORF Transcript_130112/g.362512 Transcript_130112/m.362512 type:complete len:200 (-) Transcript_130112:211-810(-)
MDLGNETPMPMSSSTSSSFEYFAKLPLPCVANNCSLASCEALRTVSFSSLSEIIGGFASLPSGTKRRVSLSLRRTWRSTSGDGARTRAGVKKQRRTTSAWRARQDCTSGSTYALVPRWAPAGGPGSCGGSSFRARSNAATVAAWLTEGTSSPNRSRAAAAAGPSPIQSRTKPNAPLSLARRGMSHARSSLVSGARYGDH